jgi:glycerophosphoryl diester phosphodiesterase
VPLLRDVLNLDWGRTHAYVELKDPTYWGTRDHRVPARVTDAALPVLREFRGSLNVISFNPEILAELRKRTADIPTTLALWTEWKGRLDEAVTLAESCGATTVSLPDILVLNDPKWISHAHARAISVHVYPVTPARGEPEFDAWKAESQIEKWRRLVEIGVDAIVSDFPRQTLEFFASLPRGVR